MAKIEERNRARTLRLQGLSFREIHALVRVPKSTLNRWLRDIELTPGQKQRLMDNEITGREKARLRGAWRNRERRRKRIAEALARAHRELPEKVHDPLFITGVVLY